jgi:hypothetical protein
MTVSDASEMLMDNDVFCIGFFACHCDADAASASTEGILFRAVGKTSGRSGIPASDGFQTLEKVT